MAYEPGRSDVPLHETSESAEGRRVGRLVAVAVIVVITVLFIAQNNEKVETTFVFVDVETRLWVSLLVAVALGVLLGQLAEALWSRRRRRRERDD
ncbi:MAG TPA: hypothetical protein VFM27_14395 [Acidimicrobiales bacterium]|jgi:uncharacterized integral membrane protein|nr:hypothetical protein [Acidimicrobiales bacterium]